MKRYKKFIIVLLVACMVCGVLCLDANAFALDPVSQGVMWAMAQSMGIGVETDLALSSDIWNDFCNDTLGGIGFNSGYAYNAADGSITVSAEDYNALCDYMADKFSNSGTWKPETVNHSAVVFRDWFQVNEASSTARLVTVDGKPYGIYSIEARYGYGNSTGRWTTNVIPASSFAAGDSISFDSSTYSHTTTRPYASVNSLVLEGLNASGNWVTVYQFYSSAASNSSFTFSSQNLEVYSYFRLAFDAGLYVPIGVNMTVLSEYGHVTFDNYDIFDSMQISGSIGGGEDSYNTTFTVKPYGALAGTAAILAHKVEIDEDIQSVNLRPLAPLGGSILASVPANDVDKILQENFFGVGVTAGVVTAVVSPTVVGSAPTESDTTDMIYGEVSWIRQLIQSLKDAYLSISGSIAEDLAAIKEKFLEPVTLPPLPDWLGGSGGGLDFGFAGIWYYVVSFVGSLGMGFTAISAAWSVLPPAFTIPIYASAVVVLVVGLYKRYIA